MKRQEVNLKPAQLVILAVILGTLGLDARRPPFPAGESAASPPAASSVDDRGTFVFTLAGREIGTEEFQIRSSAGKVAAEAQARLSAEQEGKTVGFQMSEKLVLNSQLQPLTYTWSRKGPETYTLDVDFQLSPAKSHLRRPGGQNDDRDFDLQKDVVVLDDNVVHHYQLLVARYSSTPGGRQTFHAYIPQEALPGHLTVEDSGFETIDLQGSNQKLRHLVVSTEATQVDLWVDSDQRLQRLLIPAAQLEAVRKK